MKVAINISELRNVEVADMVKAAVSSSGFHTTLDVRGCGSSAELLEFSPDILISHTNSALFNYIGGGDLSINWLHVMSAGVDKLLLPYGEALSKAGVRVSNVKGIHGIAMREYVLSMMLYFEKDISRWVRLKEISSWDRVRLPCLYGKTLLVYGAGNIGQAVGQAARSLGMYVLGVSRHGEKKGGFDKVVTSEFLHDVVGQADYILISAPKTELTLSAFDSKVLDRCKSTSVIINVSQGGILDEEYLAKCIEDKRIHGAALDVFSEEPLPENSPLWSVPGLIITPHVSGAFDFGMEFGVKCFVDNLFSFSAGNKLPTEVSLNNGY